jgi:hypothetical protein
MKHVEVDQLILYELAFNMPKTCGRPRSSSRQVDLKQKQMRSLQ